MDTPLRLPYDIRRDRQMDGIARVKADPKLRAQTYTGRKPIADEVAERVRALTAEKRAPSYIAATLGIRRMTIHRILKGGA